MVYIYGTLHFLQMSVPLSLPNSDLASTLQGKLCFAADILRILAEHLTISVVAEEGVNNFPSVAQACALMGMRCYIEIDMPKAERTRQQLISLALEDSVTLSPEIIQMIKKRDEYMVNRLLEWLPDAVDALVICGACHIPGLKKLLDAKGIETKTDCITEQQWCKDEHIGQTISSLREQIAAIDAAT